MNETHQLKNLGHIYENLKGLLLFQTGTCNIPNISQLNISLVMSLNVNNIS